MYSFFVQHTVVCVDQSTEAALPQLWHHAVGG